MNKYKRIKQIYRLHILNSADGMPVLGLFRFPTVEQGFSHNSFLVRR